MGLDLVEEPDLRNREEGANLFVIGRATCRKFHRLSASITSTSSVCCINGWESQSALVISVVFKRPATVAVYVHQLCD